MPAGADLLLFAKKRADGGIVNKIQPLLVPQLVSRFGLRWHNATVNCQVASILRNIVISHDVGGYAEHYDSLRAAAPEAEMKLVRHLRDSQAHAARNFRERIQYLVAALFNQSTDEAVNYVKQTVFGVSNGNPILSDDHPVVVAMLATHEGAQISLLLLDGTY